MPPAMVSTRFSQRQRQIELGHPVGERFAEAAVPGPARSSVPSVVVLPGKHDLEQRTVGQTAHRLNQFDDLLEGDVLMLLCGEGLRLGLLEQLADRG